MRKSLLFGAMLLVASSCTVQMEKDYESPELHRYHAVAEDPVDAETRVYADSKLRVRWNEGDHISIFERNTYNQEFEFLGDTGDTAGDFDLVESSGYHSGGDIEDGHVYAVYPYDKKNKCDYEGKLTVTFPSTQHYKKDSFGIEANVMVARTNTMDLRFMHVGGYRTVRLYGAGVSVSSIKLESNGPEFLSGRTDVTIGQSGTLSVDFIESTSNSKSVELVCDTPVALGSTAEEYVEFWFVLPPGILTEGFTITITDSNGNEFTKSTSNSIEIKSGVKKSMAAFEVEIGNIPPNNVIYYTSTDEQIVTPYKSDVFGANIVNNEYTDGQGIMLFDGDVTSIGNIAFLNCSTLSSITIPSSVTSIGSEAFSKCYSLVEFKGKYASSDGLFLADSGTLIRVAIGSVEESFDIPDGIISIGDHAFENCEKLISVELPETVVSIGEYAFVRCLMLSEIILPENVSTIKRGAFLGCKGLTELIIPDSVTTIGDHAFAGCGLTTIQLPEKLTSIENDTFEFCSSLSIISIPESVKSIGNYAFWNCTSLSDINVPNSVTSLGIYSFSGCSALCDVIIPDSVTNIGVAAFMGCSCLTTITLLSKTPPTLDDMSIWDYDHDFLGLSETNNCILFVPAESVNAYKNVDGWSDYADRIQAIPASVPIPDAIDLGLPSGLKWASFNLGASKPEEYGDLYAWGETEPKEVFSWTSYKYSEGSYRTMNKYCTNEEYGYNGFIDNKTTLDLDDDAASVTLGGEWRIPTSANWAELLNNCLISKETAVNGVKGSRLTSNLNGNSIFLPDPKCYIDTYFYNYGGGYWSSSLSTSFSYYALGRWGIGSDDLYSNPTNRCNGLSIRPVTE